MITMTAAQVILDALEAKLKNGSVFTAYDVTVDARDRTDERIGHNDVRNIVHNEWMTGQFPSEYNQESIQLCTPTQPFALVYFPDNKAATDHPLALISSNPVTPNPIPAPTTVSVPVTKTTKNTKDGDSFVCEVTNENRINIPRDILIQVSPSGGTYDIAFGTKMLYKAMNSDGRVRISAASLDNHKKYRVTANKSANTIIIEIA